MRFSRGGDIAHVGDLSLPPELYGSVVSGEEWAETPLAAQARTRKLSKG